MGNSSTCLSSSLWSTEFNACVTCTPAFVLHPLSYIVRKEDKVGLVLASLHGKKRLRGQ
jgi:hypothetical protein